MSLTLDDLAARVREASGHRRACLQTVAACACAPTCPVCEVALVGARAGLVDALERLEDAQVREDLGRRRPL